MSVTLRHAGLTDQGMVREANEDNWAADVTSGVYIVSDGMGGEFAGALASRIVVETLLPLLANSLGEENPVPESVTGETVRSAIAQVSTELRAKTKSEPGLDGMGATVVLAVIRRSSALIAHLGDSRAYLFRRGRLTRLTTDHSIIQLLLDSGDVLPDEAATHPARGRLSRFVGVDGEALPETTSLELKGRDKLLLCTDGITDMLSDADIRSLLRRRAVPKSLCVDLVSAANDAGGVDNATAVVIVCSGVGKTAS